MVEIYRKEAFINYVSRVWENRVDDSIEIEYNQSNFWVLFAVIV